ncbi:hypothetical protein IE81DRAFT_330854 [Ceraceosorus guamensis]|uniref:C2H2-type domain-containing protein n=1 Tax=Ceraceosorus guamensis TaxID=1522189 RepID=A0A316VVR1_9BASI|nr:hypothetical protein IE81DRAFT_330854 [Ceraceosorus guamensis]PWN41580.1 hypothetical protein IE81DRAFT_330854 [Ceraceosorus guamensis]
MTTINFANNAQLLAQQEKELQGQWLVKQLVPRTKATHARALQSLKEYLKAVSIKDVEHLSTAEVGQLSTYIRTDLAEELHLRTDSRTKPVATTIDLRAVLLAAYNCACGWPMVCHRYAFTGVLKVMTYSASRPGKLLLSQHNDKGMRWRNVNLIQRVVEQDGTKVVKLLAKLEFCNLKGKTLDKSLYKGQVFVLDTQDLLMCPIVNLLVLAHLQGVLLPSCGVEQILAPRTNHLVLGDHKVPFAKDALALKVFRVPEWRCDADGTKPAGHFCDFSYGSLANCLASVGQLAGIVDHLTTYAFCCLAANALNMPDVTVEDCNSVMGHAAAGVAYRCYLSMTSCLDIQGLVVYGQERREALQLPLVSTHRLPCAVFAAGRRAVLESEEVQKLRADIEKAQQTARNELGEMSFRQAQRAGLPQWKEIKAAHSALNSTVHKRLKQMWHKEIQALIKKQDLAALSGEALENLDATFALTADAQLLERVDGVDVLSSLGDMPLDDPLLIAGRDGGAADDENDEIDVDLYCDNDNGDGDDNDNNNNDGDELSTPPPPCLPRTRYAATLKGFDNLVSVLKAANGVPSDKLANAVLSMTMPCMLEGEVVDEAPPPAQPPALVKMQTLQVCPFSLLSFSHKKICKKFSRRDVASLAWHLAKSHGTAPKSGQCRICKAPVTLTTDLTAHLESAHDLLLASPGLVQAHKEKAPKLVQMLPDWTHSCELCKERFIGAAAWANHWTQHKAEFLAGVPIPLPGASSHVPKAGMCPFCVAGRPASELKTFAKIPNLVEHCQTVHMAKYMDSGEKAGGEGCSGQNAAQPQQKKQRCPFPTCRKQVGSYLDLVNHVIDLHNGPLVGAKDKLALRWDGRVEMLKFVLSARKRPTKAKEGLTPKQAKKVALTEGKTTALADKTNKAGYRVAAHPLYEDVCCCHNTELLRSIWSPELKDCTLKLHFEKRDSDPPAPPIVLSRFKTYAHWYASRAVGVPGPLGTAQGSAPDALPPVAVSTVSHHLCATVAALRRLTRIISLDAAQVTQLTLHITTNLTNELHLSTATCSKPVATSADLRAQYAFTGMLKLFTQHKCKGLRWRDIELVRQISTNLSRNKQLDLVANVKSHHLKGKRMNNGKHKGNIFVWNTREPLMCPVLNLLALASLQDAFAPGVKLASVLPASLDSLEVGQRSILWCPRKRDEKVFPMEEWRTSSRMTKENSGSGSSTAHQVDHLCDMTLGSFAYHLAASGCQCGIVEHLIPYAFCCLAANALNCPDITLEDRQSIMGHNACSAAFWAYHAMTAWVDVQGLVANGSKNCACIELPLLKDYHLPSAVLGTMLGYKLAAAVKVAQNELYHLINARLMHQWRQEVAEEIEKQNFAAFLVNILESPSAEAFSNTADARLLASPLADGVKVLTSLGDSNVKEPHEVLESLKAMLPDDMLHCVPTAGQATTPVHPSAVPALKAIEALTSCPLTYRKASKWMTCSEVSCNDASSE